MVENLVIEPHLYNLKLLTTSRIYINNYMRGG